jgi:hypothetical protein
MAKKSQITFFARGPDGSLLANAKIVVVDASNNQRAGDCTTNQNGRCTVELGKGTYFFKVFREGYQEAQGQTTLLPGQFTQSELRAMRDVGFWVRVGQQKEDVTDAIKKVLEEIRGQFGIFKPTLTQILKEDGQLKLTLEGSAMVFGTSEGFFPHDSIDFLTFKLFKDPQTINTLPVRRMVLESKICPISGIFRDDTTSACVGDNILALIQNTVQPTMQDFTDLYFQKQTYGAKIRIEWTVEDQLVGQSLILRGSFASSTATRPQVEVTILVFSPT